LTAITTEPVSEMTYAVSSGTLNSSIPYHTTTTTESVSTVILFPPVRSTIITYCIKVQLLTSMHKCSYLLNKMYTTSEAEGSLAADAYEGFPST